ncbi:MULTISPECIES: efflux RND transporter permease subunit [unclassified Bradyrhizobium]|uniref:efflux RND transporter permease subunit n=1 Tax=unclassified Bradyrhizobium TaxID=2631580 RepID=UPI0024796713|nr:MULTISPECIES: efflux RND transporter permease subunit [unclassified Bradyrhizobium]WGR68631.1 efflux RND transporter permease subunit [Bradyrhizobium sp. ISRA426]WGR80686.1 efflux RND transporter permease subunit [Bradyrhizobium sp. ISRA430]WGR83871.1 efflux RND transporter permease subunit [Bradyrhizobium sp. ISRA432]
MGIVRFALKYRHTFYVMAVAMLVLGTSAILSTPKDIFPRIDIPVITLIWQYTGLTPEEMEQRVTTYSEYSISSSVNNVRNIESQTLSGISVEKIYFQPNVNVDLAMSQIVSASNSIRNLMPEGIQPPIVVQYNASSVPVLQLSLSSDRLNEQQLYDYGIYRIRQALAPIQGITLPTPYGGKYRQIMVDIDPAALRANGLTPTDVVNAVNAQSLTLPSGDAKIGHRQYIVGINSQPSTIDDLNNVPIRQIGGTPVTLKDVAHVRDGWAVQQNVVRSEGRRSILLTIIKNGDASTLDVVDRVKAALPEIQKAAPQGMEIRPLFDQSVFVSQAIGGVVREGLIATALTALMILLFLGSWRSMLIVAVSIPLSILTSIAIFSALGQTINTMTLGGLALAIGILVDDSTVAIENTHRLFERRMDFHQAVVEGTAGIALPTLVSTLAICSVFVSLFFLHGPARFLFTPLGLAVSFAMLASYLIARTLTPIMIDLILRGERPGEHTRSTITRSFSRLHDRFNRGFERFREFYGWLLAGLLARRILVPIVAIVTVATSVAISPFIGSDFFPPVDAGLIQLHVRAPARTRIEDTERIFQKVEDKIRQHIPARDLGLVLDNIGLPQRLYNLAFTDGSTIGVNDGQILISLKEGHRPTADYVRSLREQLRQAFPDVLFYFQPADMVTQILNFGIPSQLDIEVQGQNHAENREIAKTLKQRMSSVPGLVDVHIQQELDAPELRYDIDRNRAQELGLSVRNIANDINVSLSSSEQVSPNFWTDPKAGIPYYLVVQTPQYSISSVDDIKNTPITSSASAQAPIPNVLGNVATIARRPIQSVYNHSNVQPVYDIYGSVQNSNLGEAASRIQPIVNDLNSKLKPGNRIAVRGQVESMNSAFKDLTIGLLFAALFVYLLMVVNFQSFLDPLAVLLALPGVGSGILLMLFVTGTSLSVPSLMGAIMAMGVASANSILLVAFARERRQAGADATQAALEAGKTRLRPVLMTAAAMVAGMIPMAFAGAGEEQNAVLARAVIGGVAMGTATTLLFVPYLYSVVGRYEHATASESRGGARETLR